MARIHSVLKSAFLASLLVISVYTTNSPAAGLAEIVVGRVNDGDTVTARIDGRREKIRLLGIDAPEIGQGDWGRRARECLETLLNASQRRVRIEYDLERRDKYGRLLCYLWTDNGKMANREMLKQGCAFLFLIPPNTRHAGELIEAQTLAREKQAGVWGTKGLRQRPWEYRKDHPR